MKVRDKFSCNFYVAKGGHCKKKTINNSFRTLRFGCQYPNNIKKCPYVKELKKNLFLS